MITNAKVEMYVAQWRQCI